jgi:hypothetical protein
VPERTQSNSDADILRIKMREAFADARYTGPITGVDGQPDEIYDEEQALYGNLLGKKWSEVPASFIEHYPDSVVLLTDEAFLVFLPAWLMCAIDTENVRELMVYTFSKESNESSDLIERRLRQLAPPQREALKEFLAYCLAVDSSKFIKQRAQTALDYVRSFE